MTTVAIDIDDTLYSFAQVARDKFLELAEEWDDPTIRNGAYNPWTEWRSMMDSAGPEAGEEVIRRVHQPEVILTREPFAEANRVCYAITHAGHNIHYISNRDPSTWQTTKDWLNLKGFPDGELTCNLNDKLPQVTECQYIIDDRPKTLVQFVYDSSWSDPSRGQRIGFGIAGPVNQNLTDIPGVYLSPTWRGIGYYLKKKGVLNAIAV